MVQCMPLDVQVCLDPQIDFLIHFVQGGPGCSSFDGLMMEVGPWRFDGKDSLRQKEGGWEEYANVLYRELQYFSLTITPL